MSLAAIGYNAKTIQLPTICCTAGCIGALLKSVCQRNEYYVVGNPAPEWRVPQKEEVNWL